MLSERLFETLKKKKSNEQLELIKTNEAIFLAIGENNYKPEGLCLLQMKFGDKKDYQKFFVFKGLLHNGLLGLDWLWKNDINILLNDNKLSYIADDEMKYIQFLNDNNGNEIQYKLKKSECFNPFFLFGMG